MQSEPSEAASIAAHDLRHVVGYLSFWGEGLVEQIEAGVRPSPDALQDGARAAIKAAELIEQLGQTGIEVKGQNVDVVEAIWASWEEAAQLYRTTCPLRPDPRAVRVAEDVGAVVADPKRLQQVLVNLLGNAIKHAPGQDCGVEVQRYLAAHGRQGSAVFARPGPGAERMRKYGVTMMPMARITVWHQGRPIPQNALQRSRDNRRGLWVAEVLTKAMGGHFVLNDGLQGVSIYLPLAEQHPQGSGVPAPSTFLEIDHKTGTQTEHRLG